MQYLRLCQGRRAPQDHMATEGIEGPLFGPYPSFRVVYCREILFGDQEDCTLEMENGLIYYDGIYYEDWSVLTGPLADDERMHWIAFVQERTAVPSDTACCCELPGIYHSGIPGILAPMEDGKVAPGAVVERCDICRRYASDGAAANHLIELGLGEPAEDDSPHSEFVVRCDVVVRTRMTGIRAPDFAQAAAVAKDCFDWKSLRNAARFDGNFFEFFVEGEEGVREFPGNLGETDNTHSPQKGVTHE